MGTMIYKMHDYVTVVECNLYYCKSKTVIQLCSVEKIILALQNTDFVLWWDHFPGLRLSGFFLPAHSVSP